MVDIQIVETTISGQSVRIRYADQPDAAKATEWMDIQVPLSKLAVNGQPLAQPEMEYLVEVQGAVLRYARELIGDEIRRIRELEGRTA